LRAFLGVELDSCRMGFLSSWIPVELDS